MKTMHRTYPLHLLGIYRVKASCLYRRLHVSTDGSRLSLEEKAGPGFMFMRTASCFYAGSRLSLIENAGPGFILIRTAQDSHWERMQTLVG